MNAVFGQHHGQAEVVCFHGKVGVDGHSEVPGCASNTGEMVKLA